MKKAQITVKIHPRAKEKLEAIAAAKEEDFSEIVRQALNYYLENN